MSTTQRSAGKAQHTPAPWNVTTRASEIQLNGRPVEYYAIKHTTASRTGYVALGVSPVTFSTSSGLVPNVEGEANTRLMAAAPDLLEALQRALFTVAEVAKTDSTADADLAFIRAAIARATGEDLSPRTATADGRKAKRKEVGQTKND